MFQFQQDCYAYNNSLPVVDRSQDYKLLGGSENETHTTIIFSRQWDTCDGQYVKSFALKQFWEEITQSSSLGHGYWH